MTEPMVVLILKRIPGTRYRSGDRVQLAEFERENYDRWLLDGYFSPLVMTSQGWQEVDTAIEERREGSVPPPRPMPPQNKGRGKGLTLVDPLDDIRLDDLTTPGFDLDEPQG